VAAELAAEPSLAQEVRLQVLAVLQEPAERRVLAVPVHSRGLTASSPL
jgi:hypothetical protein